MLSPVTLAALGLMLLSLLVAVAFGIDLKRFLARTPALATPEHLEEYRRVVARQMYGALLILALALAAGAVMIGGIVLHRASPAELTYLLVLGGVFVAVGAWNKSVEARAKSIAAADGEYVRQRDEIVRVWMKRPLPNW